MKFNELPASEIKFPSEVIYEQIKKIFSDSSFTGSDILKRFLLFIVEQTLSGHSNWLKEYTIGVEVLNKPSDFKPQESGIVRIHAGRLRRALNHYYNGDGANDPVYISIPKGSYVPIFADNVVSAKMVEDENIDQTISNDKLVAIAVMPFTHSDNDQKNSFTDGLCLQLTNSLMHFENLSIIAFHITRNLHEKFKDIKEIAAIVEAQYVLTGEVQSKGDRVRINIQMVEAQTSRQMWSKMFERKLNDTNFFELQDEIAKLVVSGLEEFCGSVSGKFCLQTMAVA